MTNDMGRSIEFIVQINYLCQYPILNNQIMKEDADMNEHIRNAYHLPEDLVKLIGCVPPRSDEERENVKESYLREKYGL